MAAKWQVGLKVHAVDELGRWEEGKICSVDGEKLEVSWPGWPVSYNATFGHDSPDIRLAVPPMAEQIRRK